MIDINTIGPQRLLHATILFCISLSIGSTFGEPAENSVLAHWSFDSTDQSTRFFDVSGNGFDAICSKQLATTKGVKGNALESTVSEYTFYIDNSESAFAVPSFSIEAWVYSYIDLVNIGSFYNFKTILSYQTFSPGVAKGYHLDITDSGKAQLSMAETASGWASCKGTTTLKPHQWYHLVGTYDGTTMKIYVNGVLEQSTNQPSGYIKPDQDANIACQAQVQSGVKRNWFNGLIDELTLYNYSIEGSAITARYEALRPEQEPPFEINLGMKSIYTHAGDTVIMPAYFSNFEQYSLNSLQCVLSYDPSQLTLLSISTDSGLVSDWQLFNWNEQVDGTIRVAMAGETIVLNYAEGELFRCIFSVSEKVDQNEICEIILSDIDIDEKRNLIVPNSQNGKIIIAEETVHYGDVSGNNEVSVYDALIVLNYVVGAITLPDETYPNFSLAVADVTGNKLITSYDASLILQYSVGLIPSFPIIKDQSSPTKRLEDRAADTANLDIHIKHYGTDELVFDFVGSNLRHFLAGEFTIECVSNNDSIPIGEISTTIPGAKLSSKYVSDKQVINIAIITNDDIDTDDQVTIAQIKLPPSADTEMPRFSIRSALLNDGAIISNYPNTPIASVRYRQPLGKITKPPRVFFRDNRLYVHLRYQTDATFSLYDLQGRSLVTGPITGGSALFSTKDIGKGSYIYMIRQKGMVVTGRLMNIGSPR